MAGPMNANTLKLIQIAAEQGNVAQQQGGAATREALQNKYAQQQASQKVQLAQEQETGIRNQNITTLKQLLGVPDDQPLPAGKDLFKALQGTSIAMGPGGQLNVAGKPTGPTEYQMMRYDLAQNAAAEKKQSKFEKQASDYGKKIDATSDFMDSLKQIEEATSQKNPKTGQTVSGGILTNPGAQLPGTGKVESRIPSSLLGTAELLGAVPKGTIESRKLIERARIEYQKAKAGVRGASSPAAQKQEAEAMGMVQSGDPQLAAKGLRSLAITLQKHIRNAKAGIAPEALDMAHGQLGGDPEEALSKVYHDEPLPSELTHPGAVPAGGFDPDAYLKGK